MISISFFEKFCQIVLTIRILTILTNNLCTIAFQLLIYQEEFFSKFSKNFLKTLTLVKNICFKSITIKFKEKQIKSDSINVDNCFFYDWVIDKALVRKTIKQFLKNIKKYRRISEKFRKFEKHVFQSFTSAFIEKKSLQLSLAFSSNKHIKNDSSTSKNILIVWSSINEIFQKSQWTMF